MLTTALQRRLLRRRCERLRLLQRQLVRDAGRDVTGQEVGPDRLNVADPTFFAIRLVIGLLLLCHFHFVFSSNLKLIAFQRNQNPTGPRSCQDL